MFYAQQQWNDTEARGIMNYILWMAIIIQSQHIQAHSKYEGIDPGYTTDSS